MNIQTFLLAGVLTTIFMYIMENFLMMNVYTFGGIIILVSLSAVHTYFAELALKNIWERYEKIQE